MEELRRERARPRAADDFRMIQARMEELRLERSKALAEARGRSVIHPRRYHRAASYNLGNFMRTLAMPKTAEPWSLTSLREKLIKIGARVVSHGRYVTFQMAEVALSRLMFREILMLIAGLRAPPTPA
jgi:hypothetical protein